MIFASSYKPNHYSRDRLLPHKAPTGGSKPFDFSNDHVDDLLEKASGEYNQWYGRGRAAAGILASAGIKTGETLLHISGVGMIFNAARHGAAADSTDRHLTGLDGINPAKCACKHCDEFLHYVTGQKEKKLDRRMSMMSPFIGTVESLRQKAHGLSKRFKGTRSHKRKFFACYLWIAAKDGCPVAKAIVDELFGGQDGLIKVVSAYSGILAIAVKLKST
jgi:hypothetical protein